MSDHDAVRGLFDQDKLSACISCGFCLPVCPTYQLTKDEQSSPRGRINLMRALDSGDLGPDDPALVEQASQCLGCRACEPVCPAGVEYGDLLEQWRDHQWRGSRKPLVATALMALVRRTWLLRLQGLVRRHARGRKPHARAHLLLGCVERGLYPRVSRAAADLLPDLDVSPGQGCCGALHAHNGDSTTGERLAHRLGERLPGTLVSTAGGCAAHLVAVLGRDRVVELSEALLADDRPLGKITVDGRPARVALQDSCHLRNALGVWREPRQLIDRVAEYVEIEGAADCCGAAGTYSLVRPKESRAILAKKIEAIEAAKVDFVVAVNPGCLRQLGTGLHRTRSRVRAVHIAELLSWAARSE